MQVLDFSIKKSDLELRKIFYSNIVLSGGSTLFRGQLNQEKEVYLNFQSSCSFSGVFPLLFRFW